MPGNAQTRGGARDTPPSPPVTAPPPLRCLQLNLLRSLALAPPARGRDHPARAGNSNVVAAGLQHQDRHGIRSCKAVRRKGAIPGLKLEQVAELEEETVFGRLQVGAA